MLLYSLFFVIGTLVFILSFRTALFSGTVFFYRGISLLTAVSALLTLLVIMVRRMGFIRMLTGRDIILMFVVLWTVNMLFFTHVPVTADRSISVFLLGYMNTHATVTSDDLKNSLINTYLAKNGAVDKRMTEQIASGTIIRDGKNYKITQRGRLLMLFYGWVADIFGIGKKNLSM